MIVKKGNENRRRKINRIASILIVSVHNLSESVTLIE